MKTKLSTPLRLAFALLFGVFASIAPMTVFAADITHTATITTDKTSYAPGDAVTVEVRLDATANLVSLQYYLQFDPAVFDINTATVGTGLAAHPACVDATWFNNWRTGTILLGGYLTRTIGTNPTAGTIAMVSAGAYGVDPVDNEPNCLIGKYTLTVKAGATPGPTSLSLINTETMDIGEFFGTDILFTPTSVTITAITGIENVSQASGLKAWVENGTLHVSGVSASEKWSVYTVGGTLVHQGMANDNIRLTQRGVYIVRSETGTAKVVN